MLDSDFDNIDNSLLSQLAKEYDKAENIARELRQKITTIQYACEHDCRKTDWGSAICKHCGKHCGWWCPKSKNGACDYTGQDNYHLVCKFCQYPEERK